MCAALRLARGGWQPSPVLIEARHLAISWEV
jgi:hypothetical protein